jgi:6-phosphogluconolactonase
VKGARTIVCADPSALGWRVGERIAELSRAAGGQPVAVALSGGSTPKRLYEALAAPPLRDRVDWARLRFFFGDERSVPLGDPESNAGTALRTLLAGVPTETHPMPAETGDAEAYERLVRSRVPRRRGGVPAFDLVLLGMGADGHTASLFPGTAALAERDRLVVVNDVPALGTRRMTFTYPLLNAADRVWMLVAGADKRETLARVFAAAVRGERPYPVCGVSPAGGELVWWLDRAAAGEERAA